MSDAFKQSLKPDEPALTTELIGRRIAYPFALLAKRLGMSANAVTVIAGCCWMLSLTLPFWLALIPRERNWTTAALWFAAGFLWNAGYILDMSDGSLARMTGTVSKRGFYLDYVFHLLFKPAFLLSIGLGLLITNAGNPYIVAPLILLSILSIPANWSATQSAVEHVLCDTHGKNTREPPLSPETFRLLWLGTNDITESAAKKRSAPVRFIKTCVQEVFSYYGQFTFFSITVLIDIIILFCVPASKNCSAPPMQFRVTAFFFVIVSTILIIRIPFRIIREYKRIALSDK